MCYRTKLNSQLSDIERTFNAKFSEPEHYFPQQEINGFGFPKTPVIADFSQEEILFFQWGLIPFWASDDTIKKATLNARIETLSEKPAFRQTVNNRCLIIANGFYEWQWLDPGGKKKQKYLLTPTGEDIFAFAGIYSTWKNPAKGDTIYSYSIITTEAGELMSRIHNNKKRMPVVLKARDHQEWLRGREVEDFAFPYETDLHAEITN